MIEYVSDEGNKGNYSSVRCSGNEAEKVTEEELDIANFTN